MAAVMFAAAEVVCTVFVVPFVSFSFEIVVVFPLGTAVDLSVAVAAVFSCSSQGNNQKNF